MKIKTTEQLENQVQVMQAFLAGKIIAVQPKIYDSIVSFLKMDGETFKLLIQHGNTIEESKWEETRTLPDLDDYDAFQVEIEEEKWYDNIPEHGVLCWVNDFNKDASKEKIVEIILYFDGRFISTNGSSWKYATPLTNEEISKFLRKP